MSVVAIDARIQLNILGSIHLFEKVSGQSVAFSSKKSRALLLIIADSDDGHASKAKISSLLWDQDEKRVRQSLRQEISALRKALGALSSILVITDDKVGLDLARVSIDWHTLRAISKNDTHCGLIGACHSAQRPLAENPIPAEQAFTEWYTGFGVRYHQTSVSVLDRGARHLANHGQHAAALEMALTLHQIEPLREETHRLIIGLEAIVGGRASAMARFEQFRVLLRDELATRPEPSTRQLIDRLRENDKNSSDNLAQISSTLPLSRKYKFTSFFSFLILIVVALYYIYSFLNMRNKYEYISDEGRVAISIGVMPYFIDQSSEPYREAIENWHERAIRTLTRTQVFAVVNASGVKEGINDKLLGQQLRVRYLLRAKFLHAERLYAHLQIIDASSGRIVSSQPIIVNEREGALDWNRFNRVAYWSVYQAIAKHQSETRPSTEQDSARHAFWAARHSMFIAQVGQRQMDEDTLWSSAESHAPDDPAVRIAYASHLLTRAGREQSSSKASDITKAKLLIEGMSERFPQIADITFLEGLAHKSALDYARAAEKFHKVTTIEPAHFGAYLQRFHISALQGNIDEAWLKISRLVKLDEIELSTVDSAVLAGEVGLLAGKIDVATRYFELSRSANSKVARIHAYLAAAYELSGQQKLAESAVLEMRKIDPAYSLEQFYRRGGGVNTTETARFAQARDLYVQALHSVMVRVLSTERAETK